MGGFHFLIAWVGSSDEHFLGYQGFFTEPTKSSFVCSWVNSNQDLQNERRPKDHTEFGKPARRSPRDSVGRACFCEHPCQEAVFDWSLGKPCFQIVRFPNCSDSLRDQGTRSSAVLSLGERPYQVLKSNNNPRERSQNEQQKTRQGRGTSEIGRHQRQGPRREDPVAQQFQLGPQRMEAFVRRPDEMLQKEVYKAREIRPSTSLRNKGDGNQIHQI